MHIEFTPDFVVCEEISAASIAGLSFPFTIGRIYQGQRIILSQGTDSCVLM
jgi:hypothetical protein